MAESQSSFVLDEEIIKFLVTSGKIHMNNDSQSTSFQPHTEVPSRSEDRFQNLETASTQQQEDVDIEEFLLEEVKAYPCILNTKASSIRIT